MSKQTAVDLLVSILNKEGFAPVLTNEEIQQAKQMEKEEIIDAIVQVMMKQLNIYSESGIIQLVNNAEQYYNETYGGQDVEVYSKNNTEKKYNCDYCHDMGAKYIGVPLGHLSCPQCKKY